MRSFSRRRFLGVAAAAGVAPLLRPVAGLAARPAPVDGEWLAGDFHVHTVLSHDVWGGFDDDNTGPEEFYTWGWTVAEQIANAERRRLDFLALTDHNRVDALRLDEYRSKRLVLVPGYEHSLSGGHAGIFVPHRSLLPRVLDDRGGVAAMVGAVHERGGMFVLNHPFGGSRWTRPVAETLDTDAVEVWNSSWLQRADLVPFAEANNHESIQWWEKTVVARGVRRAAVGGSDNHWRSTFALQGPGQPTTWVYAADRSAAAIIDGVRAGRTFVSAQPPALSGPTIRLSAYELWGEHRRAMVGGEVASLGPVAVHVDVENALGLRLRLVSTGRVVDDVLLLRPAARRQRVLVLPRNGWLRAELYADPGYAMAAVTSPVWTSPEVAPPPARRPPTEGRALDYGPQLVLPEVQCC